MNQTSDTKDRIDWILIFVWEFGQKFGLNMRQAFNYLKRYKAISFLDKHYDYVHTQSFNSIVVEMAEYCQRHGGKLI